MILFYGKAFLEAVPIVQILAVWSLFVVIGQPNGLLAIATKKTNLSFWYTIVRLLIMYALLISFGRISLLASAITVTAVYFIMFFVSWFMYVRKCVKLTLVEYVQIFEKPGSVIALVVVVLFVLRMFVLQYGLNVNMINGVLFLLYVSFVALCLYVLEKDRIIRLIKR